MVDQAQQWFNQRLPVDLSTVVDSLRSSLNDVITQIIRAPAQFASALLDTLLVIFLFLYALVAAPKFRDFVGELVPEDRRARVEQVMVSMAEAMGAMCAASLSVV